MQSPAYRLLLILYRVALSLPLADNKNYFHGKTRDLIEDINFFKEFDYIFSD